MKVFLHLYSLGWIPRCLHKPQCFWWKHNVSHPAWISTKKDTCKHLRRCCYAFLKQNSKITKNMKSKHFTLPLVFESTQQRQLSSQNNYWVLDTNSYIFVTSHIYYNRRSYFWRLHILGFFFFFLTCVSPHLNTSNPPLAKPTFFFHIRHN